MPKRKPLVAQLFINHIDAPKKFSFFIAPIGKGETILSTTVDTIDEAQALASAYNVKSYNF